MPILNKTKKTHTLKYKKHGKQADIQKIYNTAKWKKIREAYFQTHPLCEECLSNGKTVPAVEVHHIREISNGTTIEEMQDIAYNSNNLMSLCVECHHNIHTKRRRMKKNDNN